MQPYLERVRDVFDEEFSHRGINRRELPSNLLTALANIEVRLAAEIESTRMIAAGK